MKICSFCGIENEDDAKFCKSCGKELNKKLLLAKREKTTEIETPTALILIAWILFCLGFIPLDYSISVLVSIAILALAIILVFSKNKTAKIHGWIILIIWVIGFFTGFIYGYEYIKNYLIVANQNYQQKNVPNSTPTPPSIIYPKCISWEIIENKHIGSRVCIYGIVDYAQVFGNEIFIAFMGKKSDDPDHFFIEAKGGQTVFIGKCIIATGKLSDRIFHGFEYGLGQAILGECDDFQELNAH